MPVYLPTAATGNSRVLVTLGPSGEVMSFTYPHIDFAQNLREGLTAVHVAPSQGQAERATWLFEDHWQRTQSYLPSTNIVRTVLTSKALALTVEITDVVPPDSALLARQFRMRSHISGERSVTLLHYFRLTLGEVEWKQTVRYVPAQHAIVQSFRDITFAVGGDAFNAIRCGRAEEGDRSAKADIADGALTGQTEDIGAVDFATAWTLRVRRQAETRVLMVSAGENEAAALEQLAEAKDAGFAQLADSAEAEDRRFLKPALRQAPEDDEDIAQAYERAVLSLRLLQDAQTGAILAAPEFDPGYEECGGYGYVWPRDGAYSALALANVGHRDAAERFLDWCAKAQGEDGLWRQRYWADGSLGPTWCAPEDYEQLDQSASVMFVVGRLLAGLRGRSRATFLDRYGTMIDRGAEALLAMTDPERMHREACDLWESFHGSFTYTGAAIHAALRLLGPTMGKRLGAPAQRAAREAQRAIKETICQRLWRGTHMARGIALDGSVDEHLDSSVLGVLEPFEVLSLDDDTERAMVENSVAAIEEHLRADLHGGRGIFRFQFETYLGGAVGCVNTLWMAQVLLRLAQWHQWRYPTYAAEYLSRAKSYLRFCLKHRSPTGLFPELIGRTAEAPYWAAPHGWASGLFVECARLLKSISSG